MRPRAIVLFLAIVAVVGVSPSHAVETPCDLEDDLCAAADADASCNAVGFFASGALDVAHATTLVRNTVSDERDYQNPHATEVGYRTPSVPPPAPPEARGDLSVHLGAVESWCHSYTFDGNTKTKSCGGAKLDEVIITFNRPTMPNKVRLIVEDLTTSVCRAAEPGILGPVYDTRVGRIILEVGNGAYPINIDPQQGTVVPIGSPGTFVAMNERFASGEVSGCATAAVTGLRIANNTSQLILGGASIQTCRL